MVSVIASRALSKSMSRQHRTQCNSLCNAAHQKHAFNSMALKQKERRNNAKASIATAAQIYKHWPRLSWPVLAWSSSCKVLDCPLTQKSYYKVCTEIGVSKKAPQLILIVTMLWRVYDKASPWSLKYKNTWLGYYIHKYLVMLLQCNYNKN